MSFQQVFRPLLVCSALFAATQLATAQTKVAVINLQKALFDTAEIIKANTDMQRRSGRARHRARSCKRISRLSLRSCKGIPAS